MGAIIMIRFWSTILWFFLTCICASGVEITYYGAAREVSGSMALLEADGFTALIDVGSHYDEHPDGEIQKNSLVEPQNKFSFPFDPRVLDAVVLTHAHLDHTGRLPELFRKGFRGTIYSTFATKEILKILLKMQVRYDTTYVRKWEWSKNYKRKGRKYFTAHWRNDCPWRNKIRQHNLRTFTGRFHDLCKKYHDVNIDVIPCKICAQKELAPIWEHFSIVKYNTPIILPGKIRLVFLNAKHLPGSASVLIEIPINKRQTRRVIFSGDIGSDMSHFLQPPPIAPKADYVFVESTYGSYSRQFRSEDEYNRFIQNIASVVNKKGIVWIPSFAVDRTQKVLYEIQIGKEKGLIPQNTIVFLPSPTAKETTKLYLKYPDWHDFNISHRLSSIFRVAEKGYLDIENFHPPLNSIIITTSGMMDSALSVGLIPKLLVRSDILIAFVGYQSQFTYGGQLKAGKEYVKLDGTRIIRKAKVESFHCFSGHGDADDIDRWLSANKNSMIFLVHGESKSLEERKRDLKAKGFSNVSIVERFQKYEIK